MNKHVLWVLFLLFASQVNANEEDGNDFCEADAPCTEEKQVKPCYYCPSYYYFYGNEDLDVDVSWPGKRNDDFIESLTR